MSIERITVVEIVDNISVDDLGGNAINIINRMQDLMSIYGDSVFLEVDGEGCYSGYYQYHVCIRRIQTDDEYNHMVSELESREREENQREVHRLLERSMNGRRLTRRELAFLLRNGITLS